MRLAGILRGPFREGDVPPVDLGEWKLGDDRVLNRAIELGIVRERDGGGHEFTTGRIAAVAAALRDFGLEIDQILDVATEIRTAMGQIAERFERIWLDHVWAPIAAGNPSTSELARFQATAERVPSLALDTVVAFFTVAMENQIEGGIARELDRLERSTKSDPKS
jgi:hypothetical protein